MNLNQTLSSFSVFIVRQKIVNYRGLPSSHQSNQCYQQLTHTFFPSISFYSNKVVRSIKLMRLGSVLKTLCSINLYFKHYRALDTKLGFLNILVQLSLLIVFVYTLNPDIQRLDIFQTLLNPVFLIVDIIQIYTTF